MACYHDGRREPTIEARIGVRTIFMGRYVLRFKDGAKDVEQHVLALPSTRIVDSSPRMLLVEGPEQEVRGLAQARGWLMAEQVSIPRPTDPHPRIAGGKPQGR
jgi:hypothetical protein